MKVYTVSKQTNDSNLAHYTRPVFTIHTGLLGYTPGARPTKHISIEFEIRWKFKTL